MKYTSSALLQTLQGGALKTRTSQSFATLWKAKSSFMMQTFALFFAQLLVTYLVVTQLRKSDAFHKFMDAHMGFYLLVALILPLLLIVILAFVPMPIPMKLLLFTAFSVCFGVFLAHFKKLSPEIVKTALIGTMGIFVAMFAIGLLLVLIGVNLWWLGGILLVALLGIIITSVVFMFIDESKKAMRIKAGIAIFIFALFIMFDTNQILQRDYIGDFVTAALDYYLDVINLFMQIVQMFMSSD